MISSSPSFLNWNLTDKCNFSCKHCYTRCRPDTRELNSQETMLAIEKLAAAHVFEVNLGGGESLVRSDIFEIISGLSGNGIITDLSTNGWLVDEECAQKLKAAGISKVYVSLDHTLPEEHDDIRNMPGSYRKALEAVEKLKKKNIPVGISTVICRKNRGVMASLIQLAVKVGASEINFKKFHSIGNGAINSGDFELNRAEWEEATEELAALKEQYKDKIKITYVYSDFPIPGLTEGCPCGRTSMAMHPNGDLLMCVYGKTILGNVLRDNMQHVWKTHPFLVQNRCKHVCEAGMANKPGYIVNKKMRKQRDIRIPDGMSAMEAVKSGAFKPDSKDAVVSVIALAGKAYNLNLAGTMILEAIEAGESAEDIENNFKTVFAVKGVKDFRKDIEAMCNNMLGLNILEDISHV